MHFRSYSSWNFHCKSATSHGWCPASASIEQERIVMEEDWVERREWGRGRWKWRRKKEQLPRLEIILDVHETKSVRNYRCSSVNHWIFLQSIGVTYREITWNQFLGLNPNKRFIRLSHRPWNTVPWIFNRPKGGNARGLAFLGTNNSLFQKGKGVIFHVGLWANSVRGKQRLG